MSFRVSLTTLQKTETLCRNCKQMYAKTWRVNECFSLSHGSLRESMRNMKLCKNLPESFPRKSALEIFSWAFGFIKPPLHFRCKTSQLCCFLKTIYMLIDRCRMRHIIKVLYIWRESWLCNTFIEDTPKMLLTRVIFGVQWLNMSSVNKRPNQWLKFLSALFTRNKCSYLISLGLIRTFLFCNFSFSCTSYFDTATLLLYA